MEVREGYVRVGWRWWEHMPNAHAPWPQMVRGWPPPAPPADYVEIDWETRVGWRDSPDVVLTTMLHATVHRGADLPRARRAPGHLVDCQNYSAAAAELLGVGVRRAKDKYLAVWNTCTAERKRGIGPWPTITAELITDGVSWPPIWPRRGPPNPWKSALVTVETINGTVRVACQAGELCLWAAVWVSPWQCAIQAVHGTWEEVGQQVLGEILGVTGQLHGGERT